MAALEQLRGVMVEGNGDSFLSGSLTMNFNFHQAPMDEQTCGIRFSLQECCSHGDNGTGARSC